MHNLIRTQGYQDIELDFTNCNAAYGGPMLALATFAERYLLNQVDVDIKLPQDVKLRSLFINTNWAYLIDPRRYNPSGYKGFAQVPAIKFGTGEEQHNAVQLVIEKILSHLTGFDRSHLKAIEWSLNEITDNVINHSRSPVGGFLQVTNFSRTRRAIQFAVCDAGIGIPNSLREGNRDLQSDAEALDKAIREGVTRDTKVGQGNGLYGSWRISQLSGSSFEIHSGYASLASRARDDSLRIRPENIPFDGCLVEVGISYENPLSLEEALRFRGQPHDPADIVELSYEQDGDDHVLFPLGREAEGFGSRAAGTPIRQRLMNLIRICGGKQIVVDFSGVPIISSSFADEVFGKLFVQLGPLDFNEALEFRRVDGTIKGLINKAIEQRTKTGL